METKNSSLCIFDKQATQTDIISSSVTDYFPVTSISSGGPIEFHVPGNTETYIDINDTYIYVKLNVTKADGTDITAADKVGLNNLAVSTLFQDAGLTLGETQLEGGDQCYPFKSYFKTVMQYHPDAQSSHMSLFGWAKDEAGKFDDDSNKGFVRRAKWTEDSKECELYGPLFLDLCNQSKPIISQIDLRVRLIPSKAEFALNAYGATKDFKIKFLRVSLHVRRLLLNPSVINGHNAGLTKYNAHYPISHTELINFTIPAGQKSYIKDRLFPHQLPKLVIIGMIENEAYNGDIKKNPFNFQHFDLTSIGLYRNGESTPGRPFTPDFSKGLYAKCYANAMQVFHYLNADDTNGLTYKDYGNGYTLHAYDLTPDNDISATHRHAISTNNLRLELNFKKNLTKTINVLLFAVFDSYIEITKLRDVLTDYKR